MIEDKPDKTPPENTVGKEGISSTEQLQTDMSESPDAENIGTDVDAHGSNSLNVTMGCETAREASTKSGGEEANTEALIVKIEGCKIEDIKDVQMPEEDENKKSDSQQNNEEEEAISDVIGTAENKDNEVDDVKDALLIRNDATNAGEMKDSVAQQSPASTVPNKAKDESKPATPVKDNTARCVGGEVLFTDQGWNQLWAAIPDKQIRFTAPVLRVEAGRFFWSSEIYNKR